MLRVFAENDEVVGIVSVGCCYMKLTTEGMNGESTVTIKDEVNCIHAYTGIVL